MAKLNVTKRTHSGAKTHEGAPGAAPKNPLAALRRSVAACLLWEDTFYEDGFSVVDRIRYYVDRCDPVDVADLAWEARTRLKLRHAPLMLVNCLAEKQNLKRCPPGLLKATLPKVIQRADELAECLAIYWKDGKHPIASQMKKGLAAAFTKFNQYNLAKYNRDSAIKLRDVMMLTHPWPWQDVEGPTPAVYQRKDGTKTLRHTEGLGAVWTKLAYKELPPPDTWEVALSAAGKTGNKKAIWMRLLAEDKLGALALIRNLRNMIDAGVDDGIVRESLLKMETTRVLPFRFLTAARHTTMFEPELEVAFLKSAASLPKLPGTTVIAVDVSGSMVMSLSSRSETDRLRAAAALAALARETCEHARVIAFSDRAMEVPPRHGFALMDAIEKSMQHGGTDIRAAVKLANSWKHDRLIVLTDEQSHTEVGAPSKIGYMVNVATYKNGVGYGPWCRIDGFSESILDYISEVEGLGEVN